MIHLNRQVFIIRESKGPRTPREHLDSTPRNSRAVSHWSIPRAGEQTKKRSVCMRTHALSSNSLDSGGHVRVTFLHAYPAEPCHTPCWPLSFPDLTCARPTVAASGMECLANVLLRRAGVKEGKQESVSYSPFLPEWGDVCGQARRCRIPRPGASPFLYPGA